MRRPLLCGLDPIGSKPHSRGPGGGQGSSPPRRGMRGWPKRASLLHLRRPSEKKAGRNFKANCPFHGEKTPSFIVSPELQRYKCFGCGESGDVYTFLEKYEGLEFYDALKLLADRTGVKLTQKNASHTNEKNKISNILEKTNKYYQYMLQKSDVGKIARLYLVKERGLSVDTIKEFKIGFSPNEDKYFRSFYAKAEIDPKDLELAGVSYNRGSRAVDRFRGRVIFPLFNHRGEVIGFAGRILPQYDTGKVGKYINSPETVLYHKSSALYGLELAKQNIRENNMAIVVEGELDMISCYQAGFKNVVAIKGSAFTLEQVKILLRFCDRVTLALDADLAGDAAARRGIKIAADEGLEVKVADLGSYKDPDEAVKDSPEKFKKIIEEAIGVYDYLIKSACARFDPETGVGKSKISKELLPVLSEIDDSIVQAHYVKVLADKLGVSEEAVSKGLTENEVPQDNEVKTDLKQTTDRRSLLESRLVTIGFVDDQSVFENPEYMSLIEGNVNKKLVDCAKNELKENKKLDLNSFKESLPAELVEGFSSLIMSETVYGENVDYEKEKKVVFRELKMLKLKKQLQELGKEISRLENQSEPGELEDKQKEFEKTANKLSVLEASE